MATTSSLPESKFSTNPATIANNKSKPEGSIYANFWLSPASSSATETDTEINQVATTKTTTIDAGYSNSATTIMASNSSDSAFYCDENLLDIMPLHVEQTLGEGAFGEVKLLACRDDPNIACAVKVVDLNKNKDLRDDLLREALIHRLLTVEGERHLNVLNYISHRVTDAKQFQLFIEYVDGGELFDRIEPDVGMPVDKAKDFFRQLLDGLEYIHKNGVCHRDIKPENLLLTRKDVLKISDFGMSTIFKHKGRERFLNSSCGSLPYVAPEVMKGQYRAQPIDIWSSGIVLVAMLVGQVPWDRAEKSCEEYSLWLLGDISNDPWKRIDTRALSLLKAILNPKPDLRPSINRIRLNPWLTRRHQCDILDSEPITKAPRIISKDSGSASQPSSMLSMTIKSASSDPFSLPSKLNTSSFSIELQQLELSPIDECSADVKNNGSSMSDKNTADVSLDRTASLNYFSQPGELVLLSQTQQIDCSKNRSRLNYHNPLQRMARRMTRFCVNVKPAKAVQLIEKVCTDNGLQTKRPLSNKIVATLLRGIIELELVIVVYDMLDDGKRKILVDFRRSKGDGLEFKRLFRTLRRLLKKIICPYSDEWMFSHGLVLPVEKAIRSMDISPQAHLLDIPLSQILYKVVGYKPTTDISPAFFQSLGVAYDENQLYFPICLTIIEPVIFD